MITLKDVSMKFDLGIEKEFSFKQAFINILTPKKHKKMRQPDFYSLAVSFLLLEVFFLPSSICQNFLSLFLRQFFNRDRLIHFHSPVFPLLVVPIKFFDNFP